MKHCRNCQPPEEGSQKDVFYSRIHSSWRNLLSQEDKKDLFPHWEKRWEKIRIPPFRVCVSVAQRHSRGHFPMGQLRLKHSVAHYRSFADSAYSALCNVLLMLCSLALSTDLHTHFALSLSCGDWNSYIYVHLVNAFHGSDCVYCRHQKHALSTWV